MKCVLACIVGLLAATCQGQIIVSVSEGPPPVKYPAEVYKMTDDEFYNWAVKFNQAKADDWKKRKAEIKEPDYLTGMEEVTTREYSGSYGPSYGNGGYGGYGYGGYGSGGYGSGGYGYGGPFVQRKGIYPRRWPNPAYVGPGPLVIVNPYVRPKQ